MRIHFFFLKKNFIRVFKWILKMTILDKLNLRKTFVEYSLNEKKFESQFFESKSAAQFGLVTSLYFCFKAAQGSIIANSEKQFHVRQIRPKNLECGANCPI